MASVPNPPAGFRSAVYTLTLIGGVAAFLVKAIKDGDVTSWEELVMAAVAYLARTNLSDR